MRQRLSYRLNILPAQLCSVCPKGKLPLPMAREEERQRAHFSSEFVISVLNEGLHHGLPACWQVWVTPANEMLGIAMTQENF